MSANTKRNNQKISIWSELSGASIGVAIGLLVIVILAIVFYIFMNLSPAKRVKIDDSANIFTKSQETYIEGLVKNLSRDKDINVVVVTTRDKGRGYGNDDDSCKKFAEDYYMKNVNTVPLQNNSGICILVDLTIDEDGQRFFWLYTYGTAHFAVSNDECQGLFYKNKEYLGRGEYATAISNILKSLNDYSYKGYGAIVFFTMIIPVILAMIITKLATPSRKLDPAPAASYYRISAPTAVAGSDTFLRQTVVRIESSSSGGGGGGSSGGGGGGGGGFSGGGGGRF
ncbi:MAG: TPM domain-containing protein [Clostridiales bacterium]|nr:TPM domain-containing protein [Clostridiales bacterium]